MTSFPHHVPAGNIRLSINVKNVIVYIVVNFLAKVSYGYIVLHENLFLVFYARFIWVARGVGVSRWVKGKIYRIFLQIYN